MPAPAMGTSGETGDLVAVVTGTCVGGALTGGVVGAVLVATGTSCTVSFA